MAGETGTNSETTKGAAGTEQPTDGTPGLSVTLDIADAVSAVVWPLLILIVVLVLRKHLPEFFKHLPRLASRVSKVSIGGFSLELAKATAFAAQWSSEDDVSADLRKSMESISVTDSYFRTFITQMKDATPADYAVADLGEGEEWLSSRLYILSILLARSKTLQAFVFVRTAGSRTGKYVGWAKPEVVRWSLARKFPWLEQAYARAYSKKISGEQKAYPPTQTVQIISRTGKLGDAPENVSADPAVELMRTFLGEPVIQREKNPKPAEREEWTELKRVPGKRLFEHASWLTADTLADILGDDLHRNFVSATELAGMTDTEQVKRLLQVKQRYVPVVDDNGRFLELKNRQVLLDQAAREFLKV